MGIGIWIRVFKFTCTHTSNHLSWKIEGFEVFKETPNVLMCGREGFSWRQRPISPTEGARDTPGNAHGKGKTMNKEEQTDGFMVVQTEGPPHTQLKAIFLCRCHILWAAPRLILPELSQASVKFLQGINTAAWQDGLSKAEIALTIGERMPWPPWWDCSVQHEGGRKGPQRRRGWRNRTQSF